MRVSKSSWMLHFPPPLSAPCLTFLSQFLFISSDQLFSLLILFLLFLFCFMCTTHQSLCLAQNIFEQVNCYLSISSICWHVRNVVVIQTFLDINSLQSYIYINRADDMLIAVLNNSLQNTNSSSHHQNFRKCIFLFFLMTFLRKIHQAKWGLALFLINLWHA